MKESQPVNELSTRSESQPISSLDTSNPSPKKRVKIVDVSPAAFQFLISHFYSNNPSINKEIVGSLTYASRKYLLNGLHKSCLSFMDILLENSEISSFLKIIEEMFTYGLKEDIEKVLLKNKKIWTRLIESYNFKLLPLHFVKIILESDELNIIEENIWEACIKWAKFKFERKHSIPTSPKDNPLDGGESKSSEYDDEIDEEMMDKSLPAEGEKESESLYCTVHTQQKGPRVAGKSHVVFFATLT